jgi:DNA-directed RNA polymerase subunit RPC12/RpoP
LISLKSCGFNTLDLKIYDQRYSPVDLHILVKAKGSFIMYKCPDCKKDLTVDEIARERCQSCGSPIFGLPIPPHFIPGEDVASDSNEDQTSDGTPTLQPKLRKRTWIGSMQDQLSELRSSIQQQLSNRTNKSENQQDDGDQSEEDDIASSLPKEPSFQEESQHISNESSVNEPLSNQNTSFIEPTPLISVPEPLKTQTPSTPSQVEQIPLMKQQSSPTEPPSSAFPISYPSRPPIEGQLIQAKPVTIPPNIPPHPAPSPNFQSSPTSLPQPVQQSYLPQQPIYSTPPPPPPPNTYASYPTDVYASGPYNWPVGSGISYPHNNQQQKEPISVPLPTRRTHRGRGFVVGCMATFVLIIAATGGLFVWGFNNGWYVQLINTIETPTPSIQVTNTPVVIPTPTPKTPKDFSVYTSPGNAYSVVYPSGWDITNLHLSLNEVSQKFSSSDASNLVIIDINAPLVSSTDYTTYFSSFLGSIQVTNPQVAPEVNNITIGENTWRTLSAIGTYEDISYSCVLYGVNEGDHSAFFVTLAPVTNQTIAYVQFYQPMLESFKFL